MFSPRTLHAVGRGSLAGGTHARHAHVYPPGFRIDFNCQIEIIGAYE